MMGAEARLPTMWDHQLDAQVKIQQSVLWVQHWCQLPCWLCS
jgi:hypothetical protein